MAMETALVGLSFPLAVKELTGLFSRRGYRILKEEFQARRIVVYRKASWYRRARKIILHLTPLEKNHTRIDITAIIDTRHPTDDVRLEENLTTIICRQLQHP